MSDYSVTDDTIRAEIHKAEVWIGHHEDIRKRCLDLDVNVGLAIGIDLMRANIRGLRDRLCPDHQPSLFGDA
jgi:hypothetical protein